MTQYTTEVHTFSGLTTSPGVFNLFGGNYAITVHTTTWGSGSVVLQRQAADGITMVTCVPTFTSDGYATAYLPAGTYKIAMTTATGVNIDVSSITVNK